MNKVILDGRLTTDPRKDSKTGAVYFTLACERTYKTKDGKKIVDYPEIQCWGNNATFAGKYFKKGTGVIIDGEINTSAVKDDGGKQIGTRLLVKAGSLQFPKGNKSSNDIEKGDA